ncbi:Thiamine-monophosphate kinase [Pseudobythopirellula maris]|uniref:Thiamine-monophosphate kinase n=1 Tax=Pseudobythopirellula maris TaxID=2527991 RepID=A0A5C5ZSI0_9BACT|nr:thiamine-phosphate kinase [Pseudobythopirellula maris]TWT90502.1 Thiamine-monophosphate kinase [Pseudobythopirellula maris]
MELEFVRWLTKRLPPHPRLRIGPGDDAALLELAAGEGVVVTADLLIDGVHFLASETALERIGHKCLAVNLSDLAAMAARPLAAVVSLALPRDGVSGIGPRETAAQLIEGMLPLCERLEVCIAGGDTNVHAGPLVVAVTALGESTPHGVLRRDGAKPGDALLVTGSLGGSLLGKHLDFTPRCEEALRLADSYTLHAGMDLSDGLSMDLPRLAAASGVGAVVEAAAIPMSDDAHEAAARSGRTPIDHALGDGEDFELLLAVVADEAERMLAEAPLACGLTRIGEVVAERGIFLQGAEGKRTPLEAAGYEHR